MATVEESITKDLFSNIDQVKYASGEIELKQVDQRKHRSPAAKIEYPNRTDCRCWWNLSIKLCIDLRCWMNVCLVMDPDIVVFEVQLHHLSPYLFINHPFILLHLCLKGIVLDEGFEPVFDKCAAKGWIIN